MKALTKIEVEARIAKLKIDPVGNAKLIKKWERKLKKFEAMEAYPF